MIRIPKTRRSPHPGAMLKEEFLVPMGLTQQALADGIRVPFQRLNEIVSGRRALLQHGPPSRQILWDVAGFWLNLQMVYDLQQAGEKGRYLKDIRRVKATQ